jgi:hypothetical protein
VGAYRLEVRRRDEERRGRELDAQHVILREILDLSSLNHQQLSTMAPEGHLNHNLRPLHGNEQFREVVRRFMRMQALAYATGDAGVIESTNECFRPIKEYLAEISKGEFSDEADLRVLSPDERPYQALWHVLGRRLAAR